MLGMFLNLKQQKYIVARMPRKEKKERKGQRGKYGEESLCFRLGRKGKDSEERKVRTARKGW